MNFPGFNVTHKKKKVTVDTVSLDAFKALFHLVPEEEHGRVMGLEQHFDDAEQTTNPLWLEARKHRITGSVVASIVGLNPYTSRLQYLKQKLWPVEMDARGKMACRYGNLNEPVAEAYFEQYMRQQIGTMKNRNGDVLTDVKVENLGLYVCKQAGYGMLGMSPDGICTTTWRCEETEEEYQLQELIEYKCPASWKKLVARDDGNMYPEEKLPPFNYPRSLERARLPCPKYYFCQVQYGMELFRRSGMPLERCYFVVWSPETKEEVVWLREPLAEAKQAGDEYVAPNERGTFKEDTPQGAFSATIVYHGRTQITVVKRDAAFGAYLVEEAKRFWEDMYAPRHIMKQNNQIEDGEVDVTVTIVPTPAVPQDAKEPSTKKQKIGV